MLCKNVNGSLVRIEATLKVVNDKLDALAAADNERVTWDAHDRHKAECRNELEKIKGRPSWAVATIIGLLSTGLATTLTLLLTGVIK
jgi:hypothetical protein